MQPKLVIFSSALIFLLMPPAQGQPAESIFPYTLQVASFPDTAFAAKYADRLSRAGESVGFGLVELYGRGYWTRVYVGSFKTQTEAREYGNMLVGRKLIIEYLVKSAAELQSLSRPHTATSKPVAMEPRAPQAATASPALADLPIIMAPVQLVSSRVAIPNLPPRPEAKSAPPSAITDRASRLLYRQPQLSRQMAALLAPLRVTPLTLPVANDLQLHLAPVIDREAVPRPDPAYLAFNLISENRGGRGGLWVSGDREEALARLRYTLGDRPELITLDAYGAVRINRSLLAEAADADRVAAEEAPVRIAEYIAANEGLLLLVQLTQGVRRYLFHIGRLAPTLGGVIDVSGGINLDNNYDSRINPYRRDGRKLDCERPPKGFDSLVAINPEARWLNLRANEFVTAGQITFHELAEAHAKVVLNLDYLEQDSHRGAHNIALEREERLKAQRPSANIVLTVGANRLFKSEDEVRHFHAQAGQAAGHQR